MGKRIKAALLALAAVLSVVLSFVSCSAPPENLTRRFYGYFDTECLVSAKAGEDGETFKLVCDEVDKILSFYHRQLDIYFEYSGINNLKTVNDAAGGEPVAVSAELVEFLLFAKEVYSLTRGEVNVAMGPVLRLWSAARDAAAGGKGYVPDRESLDAALCHCSIDSLEIDERALTVRLASPTASLDVGALGKGFVAKKVAERLGELSVDGYAVNLGGNIRIVGKTPWTVGITNPDKSVGGFTRVISLGDTSFVTSGDYERFFTVGNKNYHHIIDKDTAMPAEYFRSVSIVAEDSGLADALSTALFCMSYEDGLEVATELGAEVMWILADGAVLTTPGFPAAIE